MKQMNIIKYKKVMNLEILKKQNNQNIRLVRLKVYLK